MALTESKTEAPRGAPADAGKAPPSGGQSRNALLMRAAGAVLLIAGWAYFALPQFGSAQFFLDTLVFCAFGAYAFIAAYSARHETVTLEKRLRLGLILRNMELENMTARDQLTHLFDRRHFFGRLERELQTAKGFHRPLSVLVIDLNGMKRVNNSHGHTIGDQVLAAFGRFLADQARGSDVPARIGGDEFAVILPDSEEQAAQAAVTRLLKALDSTTLFEDNDVTLKLTAAIGASGYPWGAETVDEIMRLAGESMSAHRREQQAMAGTGTASANDS